MTIDTACEVGADRGDLRVGVDKTGRPAAVLNARWLRVIILFSISAHVFLLAWEARHDSATWDEVGHFAAAWSYDRFGTFGLYRVNPPLVRLIAGIPLRWMVKSDVDFDLYRYPSSPADRTEFTLGSRLAAELGPAYFWCLAVSRFFCIPLSLVGAWVCYLWTRDLYSRGAAVFVLLIWCFDPIVLAYGHLITPDMGATSLGLAAGYLFWKWLRAPKWSRALWAGVLLGLAELAKTTWLILFVLWPVMWLIYRRHSERSFEGKGVAPTGRQLGLILFCGFYLINLGYGFEGTFTRLGDYRFVSHLFSGRRDAVGVGNRWNDSPLARVPVPLPAYYLSGIDVQRRDFEQRSYSFLNGQWKLGGWWYYYLYALIIKEPIGTLLLAVLALSLYPVHRHTRLLDEFMVLLAGAAVLAAVSSQTGFNHHVRYVMPALPFFYILVARLADIRATGRVRAISFAALGLSICSSLWIFPHSMSYFNLLIGGPKNGYRHLANSNTDWGQDLLYLKQWLEDHPAHGAIHLAYDLPLIDPHLVGIDYERVPVGPAPGRDHDEPELLGPLPGTYVISVNQISLLEGGFAYFEFFEPVDRIGYSMNVYVITVRQANAVRGKLGLSPIAAR